VPSGYGSRVNRDSRRFKCTANHTDFFFPPDRLIVDNNSMPSRQQKSSIASYSDGESFVEDSVSMEDRSSSDVLDDEVMPSHVLQAYESMLRQKVKEQEENFNAVSKELQDELRSYPFWLMH
jgi:hypothetical protein